MKSRHSKEEIRHIMNVLRQGTISWSGRKEALAKARIKRFERWTKPRKGKPSRKLYKLWWVCAKCGREEREENLVQVDHIEEIGSFQGCWDDYVHRVYCRPENLQVLCLTCHKSKTAIFTNARKEFQRKKRRAT